MSQQYLNKELLEQLQADFPAIVEIFGESAPYQFIVNPKNILEVLEYLKNNKQFDFSMLNNLTAVDYKEYLEIVYHLYSYDKKHMAIVKVRLSKEKPSIESVVPIWQTADFQEREVFDLFGIWFKNHPNMKRILLPEDFVGHPLLKDFQMLNEEKRG
mgnify:FL=1